MLVFVCGGNAPAHAPPRVMVTSVAPQHHTSSCIEVTKRRPADGLRYPLSAHPDDTEVQKGSARFWWICATASQATSRHQVYVPSRPAAPLHIWLV